MPSLSGIKWALKNRRSVPGAIEQKRIQRALRKTGVQIGPRCTIAKGAEMSPTVELGTGVTVRERCLIGGDAPIRIGNYTGLALGAQIRASNYDTSYAFTSPLLQKRLGLAPRRISAPVAIGAACWIGTNALILSGVTIGHGAIVGAGAVVTKDVAPFTIVGGNPAKVIGRRFSAETEKRLLDLAWWEWSEEEMRRNLELFAEPLE